MGLKNLIRRFFDRKYDKLYRKELARRQIPYAEWIEETEGLFVPFQGSMREDAEAMLICNPDGERSKMAGRWIREWFVRYPDALVLYGDEDVRGEDGVRRSPYFKPDWSPDLFDTEFYLGGLVAVRKSWLETCDKSLFSDVWTEDATRCRQNLIRRIVQLAGGYEKGKGRETIRHIPRILFHARSEESRTRFMQYEDSDKTQGEPVAAEAMLSIIIPSKDNPPLLKKCLESIFRAAQGCRYEVIAVDNGSTPDNRERIEALLKEIRQRKEPGLVRILYHYEPMEFNFSAMCNLGVRKASEELLLFLNDDVELVKQGSLRDMALLAVRPYTGAVGIKLLYPEEKAAGRIQHAGIVNLPMGPVHKLQFCEDREEYYFGWNRGRHNAMAVTAACLMIEKRKFQEAGGFDEELAVAFNDVDLCFKIYEAGYENVCICDSFAYHDESYSRGDDESADKLQRLLGERDRLYRKALSRTAKPWDGEDALRDPYYSVYLNSEGLDTRIRPMFETAGNWTQTVKDAQILPEKHPVGYRQDPCLMIRIESISGDKTIIGWSIVSGDNNACYEKMLVLQSQQGCCTIPLKPQYRPDLAENMPDQQNVGLSGFYIRLEENSLPPGRYMVGVMARRTVGRIRLINWSNRTLEL